MPLHNLKLRTAAEKLIFPSNTFIPLSTYMTQCNAHYYGVQNSIGSSGDFITAPEISQMFGEILGAWIITRWHQMGRPVPFQLIELGPGKGTLMADALRVMRGHADIYAAVGVHLVETSMRLRGMQLENLAAFHPSKTWHDDLGDIPHAPFILIANEFLDALPIQQFIYTITGWQERGVMFDGEKISWATAPLPPGWQPEISPYMHAPVPGNILEASVAAIAAVEAVTARMAAQNGSALIIDYGYARTDYGDTFQAVSQHEYANPLEQPGECDLTAHVNFTAIENLARAHDLQVSGPIGQGEFLSSLGLKLRAEKLLANTADPNDKLEIIEAAYRLTSADEMGTLFKVISLSSPGLPLPEGFHAPHRSPT